MNVSFYSDLLSSISERGRGLIGLSRGDEHARASVADIVKLSRELISRRGEASGVALARIILDTRMLLRPGAIRSRAQIQVHEPSSASNSGTAASAAFWVELSVT